MEGPGQTAARGVATIAIVATLTFLADFLDFRSLWNLVWMAGIPLACALPLGAPLSSLVRVFALLGLSVLTMIVTAVLFHLGP